VVNLLELTLWPYNSVGEAPRQLMRECVNTIYFVLLLTAIKTNHPKATPRSPLTSAIF
jgi:hypothetical protein